MRRAGFAEAGVLGLFLAGAGPAPAQVVEPPIFELAPGAQALLTNHHTGTPYCSMAPGVSGPSRAICDVTNVGQDSRLQVEAEVTNVHSSATADGQIYWDFTVPSLLGDTTGDVVEVQAAVSLRWKGFYVVNGISGSRADAQIQLHLIDVAAGVAIDAAMVHEGGVDGENPGGFFDLAPQAFLDDSGGYRNATVRGLVQRNKRYRVLVQIEASTDTRTVASLASNFAGGDYGLFIHKVAVRASDDLPRRTLLHAAASATSAADAAAAAAAVRDLMEGQVLPGVAGLAQKVVGLAAETGAGFTSVNGRLDELSWRLGGVRKEVEVEVEPLSRRRWLIATTLAGEPVPVDFTSITAFVAGHAGRVESVNVLAHASPTELATGLYELALDRPAGPQSKARDVVVSFQVRHTTSNAVSYSGSALYKPGSE
jgi:hypothetical protein